MEELNIELDRAFDALVKHKEKMLVYRKALEELSELSVAILKHMNKNESELFILEELVDVSFNIKLLSRFFNKGDIDRMTMEKAGKFFNTDDFKKYCK